MERTTHLFEWFFFSYIYDATGVKLQKNVLINGVNSPTDYAGNYIYENGNLKQISQPEGYINKMEQIGNMSIT